MAIIPIQNLGRGGIIRDVHSTATPLQGWSNGRNVGFENGKVIRSPIWRKVHVTSVGPAARFCLNQSTLNGNDKLIVVRDDLSVGVYDSGSVTSINEAGFVAAAASTSPISATILGEVVYINRPDRVPRILKPGAVALVALPAWDATHRAGVIRRYNDQILAMNVTKGATAVPSMVKVSDLALYGDAPLSWDSTDPTTLAYENPLSALSGPILDGALLGDRFLFYTSSQMWEMRAGGPLDFTFRQVFSENGIVNTNCVVEVNNKHYVFGPSDIYMTDGASRTSLADGRVREWLYRTLNMSLSERFFVQHLPATNEILFAGVSGDSGCAWKLPTGCNNGAVYNMVTDVWSFVDLPNVTAMALCNINDTLLYSTASQRTYAGVGGSYYDQQDGSEVHAVAINQPLMTAGSLTTLTGGMILGYDFVDRGQLAFQVSTECLSPSFVERTGIGLDTPEVGAAPLTMLKEIRAVYPEVTISRPVGLQIALGGQMTSSGPVVWETASVFDPVTEYFVNSRVTGRYLAIRFTFEPMADTEVSGFDLDVVSNGFR